MTESRSGWRRIWGLHVRLLHWGLATLVAVAWLTGEGAPRLHDAAGYGALALIGFRLVLGLAGPPPARFARFVVGWRLTLAYAHKILEGRERRFLGHNPLGAWMIVSLLSVAFGAGLTGWLYTTDKFWGVAWMEWLHAGLADVLLVLIFLHVAGVLFTSYRQGENLVAAMVHGRKPRTTLRHPEEAVDP